MPSHCTAEADFGDYVRFCEKRDPSFDSAHKYIRRWAYQEKSRKDGENRQSDEKEKRLKMRMPKSYRRWMMSKFG